MNLNDLERRNSPILRHFSPYSIALQANYVTVVEARLIMSVNIVFQFQLSTSDHHYHTLQHGLSAIAELLVLTVTISGVGGLCFEGDD